MTAVIQEHNEQIEQEECPWEDIETLTANGISAVIICNKNPNLFLILKSI
jgi:hypothetical protein